MGVGLEVGGEAQLVGSHLVAEFAERLLRLLPPSPGTGPGTGTDSRSRPAGPTGDPLELARGRGAGRNQPGSPTRPARRPTLLARRNAGTRPEGRPNAAGDPAGARRCSAQPDWRLPTNGVDGRAALPAFGATRSAPGAGGARVAAAKRPLPQWRAAGPGQRGLGAAVDREECFDTVGKGTLSVNRSPAAAE